MATHAKAKSSEDKLVIEKLRQEGGVLSPSEIVLGTHLPYDTVKSAVDRLQGEGVVQVDEDEVPIVRLQE